METLNNFLADGPFLAVFAFLTVVVFFRAQGTYWLGRWATSLAVRHISPKDGWRKRAVDWLDSPTVAKGSASIHKWGLPIIPISFLTVGFQSVVQAAAGILRTPWWRYTVWMIPGTLVWALIYSTIGFAMWEAMIAAAAGSPWGIGALVIALGATAILIRRKRMRLATAATQPEESGASIAAP